MVSGLLDQLQILTVVSDKISRAFNRSRVTQAVAHDIPIAFERVWHACFLHKLSSYEISSQVFGLISSFLSYRWLDGKSSHKYTVNDGVPEGTILGPTLFLPFINNRPGDVICDIAIYADDTTLYSKCDQASNLWQQLELTSELESDLWFFVDWDKKGVGDFNAEKTQLDRPNNMGATDVKMDGSSLEKKIAF